MTPDPIPSGPDPRLAERDRFSRFHFVAWLGFLLPCLVLWETTRSLLGLTALSLCVLPPLAIAWLVGTIRHGVRRRWRRAASALLGGPLAIALLVGLALVGLDPDRIHFLLVKVPHEIEIGALHDGKAAPHSWSWGLAAMPFSAGVGYTLEYDRTDAPRHLAGEPGKLVRSMGDHFYLVEESEDGSPP